jgi:hypothetical protein
MLSLVVPQARLSAHLPNNVSTFSHVATFGTNVETAISSFKAPDPVQQQINVTFCQPVVQTAALIARQVSVLAQQVNHGVFLLNRALLFQLVVQQVTPAETVSLSLQEMPGV